MSSLPLVSHYLVQYMQTLLVPLFPPRKVYFPVTTIQHLRNLRKPAHLDQVTKQAESTVSVSVLAAYTGKNKQTW